MSKTGKGVSYFQSIKNQPPLLNKLNSDIKMLQKKDISTYFNHLLQIRLSLSGFLGRMVVSDVNPR